MECWIAQNILSWEFYLTKLLTADIKRQVIIYYHWPNFDKKTNIISTKCEHVIFGQNLSHNYQYNNGMLFREHSILFRRIFDGSYS